MNNKKGRSFYITLAVLFCIIYIFSAVKPLGTEYQMTPEWKIDVTNPSVSEKDEKAEDGTVEKPLPFKLGQKMGYFTADGRVLNFQTFPQKASISEYFYTYYSNNNSSAKFYRPDGTEAGTLNFSGFPMIDEDRVFVFLPGGTSFVMCDETGKFKWEYSGTAPLTGFDSSEKGIAAGFADGNICQFDYNGNLIQRFAPGGSDLPVISGVAVSESGKYIASVCGQNRTRFVLAETSEAQPKIIFHEFLDSRKTRQNLVKFSSDDSTVFYNCDNILGIYSLKNGKKAHLKINGQAISIQEAGKCTYVLTKDGNRYAVYCIEKFATLTGSFAFEAQTAFIQTRDNKLYIGKDSSISCIKLEKK